jgi:predicted acyltransferase
MMVFVNELSGVSNVPGWMKHRAADFDGMTFVDVVFPAFLFIVGMAIPFAVSNRESKGDTPFEFWKHVIIRTAGLLILGIFMVNSAEMNREANLIPYGLWAASFYIAAILIWNLYPKTEDKPRQNIYAGLKVLGTVVLVVLFFLFRKGPEGELTGMTPSWWGILGLIGWAYLISILMYFVGKKNFYALIGIFILLLVLLMGLRSDSTIFPFNIEFLKGQTGHIAHSLLTISGIICSILLRKDGVMEAPYGKIRNMVIMGVVLAVAAYFIRPYGGISKIYATPAWALYCAAICCIIFPFIYWLVDVKGLKNWANFLKPAGQNPLLTYILPSLIYAIIGFGFFPTWLKDGAVGFFWAIAFSLIILWIAKWLTKKGIRLHL